MSYEPVLDPPRDSYSTISLDPPWIEPGGDGRGADHHYPTLPRHEIARVVTSADAWRPARDCHVWCWTTTTSLLDGLWLLDALGARYVTHAVWCKVTARSLPAQVTIGEAPAADGLVAELGLGQYLRGSHELLLFGTIGRGYAVRTAERTIPSVFWAPRPRDDDGRRVHSRKPAKAFELIERRSAGPYLEMFGRGSPRPGWDIWGNEAVAA